MGNVQVLEEPYGTTGLQKTSTKPNRRAIANRDVKESMKETKNPFHIAGQIFLKDQNGKGMALSTSSARNFRSFSREGKTRGCGNGNGNGNERGEKVYLLAQSVADSRSRRREIEMAKPEA